MKTLNTISKIIQSIKNRLVKSDSTINNKIEETVVVNDYNGILFEINQQEEEFLFI